jgi:polyphenol oxidase
MKNISVLPLVDPVFSQNEGIQHGFFNRYGGHSSPPYMSNNVSYGVGDQVENIQKNREEIKVTLGISLLLSAHQVHGDKVYSSKFREVKNDMEVDGFDALITDQVGVGLMIQQADCQAVLLYDPVCRVIAAVHCGWRGSVLGIIGKTVEVMTYDYGCNSSDMVAAISPSLGPCCAEFVNHKSELPQEFQSFQMEDCYFDFWQISRLQLRTSGVKNDAVHAVEVCTCCSQEYFSYRRSRREGAINTGRNCSVIALCDE